MKRPCKRNLPLAAGALLLALAILLGGAGLIPHGVKLCLLVLSCALELWAVFQKSRKERTGEP